MEYTKDQILNFINSIGSNKPPSETDMKAAAYALEELLGDIDVRKKLGLSKSPGQRGKIFDPKSATSKHPLFSIAMKIEANEISVDEGIKQAQGHTFLGERATRTHMKPIREDARKTLEFIGRLDSLATKK